VGNKIYKQIRRELQDTIIAKHCSSNGCIGKRIRYVISLLWQTVDYMPKKGNYVCVTYAYATITFCTRPPLCFAVAEHVD